MARKSDKGAILIIDDDADVRAAIRDTLADEGYQVAEAGGGFEALSYLNTHPPPALILLDWNMAPMNAPQFMEQFCKQPKFSHVPVVLITADAQANRKVKTGGYHSFLRKPMDLDLLFSVVTQLAG